MDRTNFTAIGFGVIIIGAFAFFLFSGEDSNSLKNRKKSLFSKKYFKAKTLTANVAPLEALKLTNKLVKKDDRYLVGANLKPIKELPKKAKAINKPKPTWKKELLKKIDDQVLTGHDRELDIEHIASGSLAHPKYIQYIEAVKINFNQKNGQPGSFEGIVDSESGDLLHTYRHEYDKSIEPTKELREYYSPDTREGQEANLDEIKEFERRIASQEFDDIDRETVMTDEKKESYHHKIYDDAEEKSYFKVQKKLEQKKSELKEFLELENP